MKIDRIKELADELPPIIFDDYSKWRDIFSSILQNEGESQEVVIAFPKGAPRWASFFAKFGPDEEGQDYFWFEEFPSGQVRDSFMTAFTEQADKTGPFGFRVRADLHSWSPSIRLLK